PPDPRARPSPGRGSDRPNAADKSRVEPIIAEFSRTAECHRTEPGSAERSIPAGAREAARALRWPRPVPAALPAPGAVPAPPGRGSGRGSPGRRRPCVPEEPPEEPLSCREPRSVRAGSAGRDFWRFFAV
ncbi:unnamed protein product, partial [Coccothraustes coccothraustes]